ncbi:hypothetical protein [Arthrobacter sunyaminii]|uniref:DUF4386 domain-containing protein n=1 Tax=Arthrobacter sunyaminii TaxID=2816859 RepID=A0A975S626_9MICC|nr:hypothetical protein [Arthrobacter sunyaminii]MBO0909677.1 hypothetical protein [Arthrobacter sunyaminii]QWQ36483.1 hypothetical protein KG104_01230 [Arthrobacter sunyaminii]
MTPTRILLLAAALAAPILFVTGQALLPNLGRDPATAFPLMLEYRDQLILSRLLTTAGAYLLLPLFWLVAGLGGTVTRAGAAIAAVGTFFNAVSQAVQGYAAWGATAPGLDHGASMQTLLHLEDGPAGLAVSYWSVPLFGIGLSVMGIGLLIAKSAPRWMPLLLLAGVVLGFLTAGQGPVVALTQIPLVAALIALAVYKVFSLAPQPASVHTDA